jgi:spore coat polysaccharide biosynthesis predicted glycosyltransferase SpsG
MVSYIYNQKSENIDFKDLAEAINKLIFNNLHNPPPTKYVDTIVNPLYSKHLLNLVLVEDCGGI